jgi:hypothetical protein
MANALLAKLFPRSDAPWMFLIGVWLASPFLAYGLPEHPLTLWPWTIPFTDSVARVIPAIDRLTALSKMPEMTRFFMSLQWAVWGPVSFWIWFRFGRPTEKSMIIAMRVAQARWWYSILAPFAMVAMVWLLVTLGPINDRTLTTPFGRMIVWMSESRFWLGLFGSISVSIAAFALVAFLKSFTVIRLAYAVRASSPLYKGKHK